MLFKIVLHFIELLTHRLDFVQHLVYGFKHLGYFTQTHLKKGLDRRVLDFASAKIIQPLEYIPTQINVRFKRKANSINRTRRSLGKNRRIASTQDSVAFIKGLTESLPVIVQLAHVVHGVPGKFDLRANRRFKSGDSGASV